MTADTLNYHKMFILLFSIGINDILKTFRFILSYRLYLP